MKIEDLWKKYKKTEDENLKKKLIVEYLPLVKIISGRMYSLYGGNVEYDDLMGFGVFGLIDAIDKFDLSRDLRFETYAQIRIRGAIIDNLRRIDWVPRRVRKKAKDIENVIRELENKYGRSVSNEEIAEEMDISVEELAAMLSEVSITNLVSLEETLVKRDDSSMVSEESTPEERLEDKEVKKILSQKVDQLKENEKLVVSMYYFDELTYKEIGKVLDLSESRISQIHSKAMMNLRTSLKEMGINGY